MSATNRVQRIWGRWKQRVRLSRGYRRQWMPLQSGMLKKCGVLLTSVMLLLTGCATAPSVCPRMPELTARVPLGPSYLAETQNFLSGKLPELMSSAKP